jgi:hypothetical protein
MPFMQDLAINRVIDSVLATLNGLTATSLAGVGVYDGTPVTSPGDSELVLVGRDGTPDSDARPSCTWEPASLANDSGYERGTVPIAVVVQSGATEIDVLRDRASEIYAVIAAALYVDRTIGGTAMVSNFSGGSQATYQNTEGSAVVLSFEITYMAQV